MPSKTPSVQTTAQSPIKTTQAEVIRLAIDLVDIADTAKCSMEEMRQVLRAIRRLASEDEAIKGLADLGLTVADDRHNTFDCDAESAREMLAAMKGVGHA